MYLLKLAIANHDVHNTYCLACCCDVVYYCSISATILFHLKLLIKLKTEKNSYTRVARPKSQPIDFSFVVLVSVLSHTATIAQHNG